MFEWDPNKAESNLKKHGISFEQACEVFTDPNALDGPDVLHSSASEIRFLRIGSDMNGSVITMAYTIRGRKNGEKKIRIISARKASKKEKKAYSKD